MPGFPGNDVKHVALPPVLAGDKGFSGLADSEGNPVSDAFKDGRRDLLIEAVAQKVAFVPGQSFHPDGSGRNTMRLNFSNVSPERLKLGIERLGRAIEGRLAASPV